MYVRPPHTSRQKVDLPENYGGSAFSSSGYYNDMPPPARQTPPKNDAASEHVNPNLPQRYVDDVPDRRDEPLHNADDRDGEMRDGENEPSKARATSLLSSLVPSINSSSHFPFGHGIGGEELLILGIMLLVYLSGVENGKTDNEFILLLALLLFAG